MRRRGRGATLAAVIVSPQELEVRSARGELPREQYQQRRAPGHLIPTPPNA